MLNPFQNVLNEPFLSPSILDTKKKFETTSLASQNLQVVLFCLLRFSQNIQLPECSGTLSKLQTLSKR